MVPVQLQLDQEAAPINQLLIMYFACKKENIKPVFYDTRQFQF